MGRGPVRQFRARGGAVALLGVVGVVVCQLTVGLPALNAPSQAQGSPSNDRQPQTAAAVSAAASPAQASAATPEPAPAPTLAAAGAAPAAPQSIAAPARSFRVAENFEVAE